MYDENNSDDGYSTYTDQDFESNSGESANGCNFNETNDDYDYDEDSEDEDEDEDDKGDGEDADIPFLRRIHLITPTICDNCQTMTATLWRRDFEGKPHCMFLHICCTMLVLSQRTIGDACDWFSVSFPLASEIFICLDAETL